MRINIYRRGQYEYLFDYSNEEIAKSCNIDLDVFKRCLKNNYDGFIEGGFMGFRNREDANAAFEWVQAAILMAEMSKKEEPKLKPKLGGGIPVGTIYPIWEQGWMQPSGIEPVFSTTYNRVSYGPPISKGKVNPAVFIK